MKIVVVYEILAKIEIVTPSWMLELMLIKIPWYYSGLMVRSPRHISDRGVNYFSILCFDDWNVQIISIRNSVGLLLVGVDPRYDLFKSSAKKSIHDDDWLPNWLLVWWSLSGHRLVERRGLLLRSHNGDQCQHWTVGTLFCLLCDWMNTRMYPIHSSIHSMYPIHSMNDNLSFHDLIKYY